MKDHISNTRSQESAHQSTKNGWCVCVCVLHQFTDDEGRVITGGSSSSTGGLKQGDGRNDGNVTDEGICTEDPNRAQAAGLASSGNSQKQKIEQHYVTHIPYLAWCPRCVQGKV